jgi:hypothetical protein
MELSEIEEGVELSIAKWIELERMRQRPLELTNGAKKLVVQMIANIEKDPSPYWESVELDAVQRFAISTLPNILIEIGQRYRRFNREQKIFSSWEILHNISRALDKWCPIPKDI